MALRSNRTGPLARIRGLWPIALAATALACNRGFAADLPDLIRPDTIAEGVFDTAAAASPRAMPGVEPAVEKLLLSFFEVVQAAERAAQGPDARPTVPDAPAPAAVPSPTVVVYGVPGCGPCRNVREHLRSRGVAFTYRDVSESDDANRELHRKLRRARLMTNAVPVTDIDGKLVVGANTYEIDRRLGITRS